MKGQQPDCVTSSGSMEILTGIESVPETTKRQDINHNALTTVEITPVKAPCEIKSAIRRQKRTETLDYIWHALPVSRSSKPLYRAVLRGSLHPSNIQYSITNVNGHSLKTANGCHKDESLVTNNDLKDVSQSGGALRVAGISINDIKFQEPVGRLSPRARLGHTLPVSRHMRPNFLEQKSSSSASGFKNRKMDYSMDVTEDSLRYVPTFSPAKVFNGISQPKPSNGYGDKSKLFTPLVDESNRGVPLMSSPSVSSPPLAQNIISESYNQKENFQAATDQRGESNGTTSSNFTTATKNQKSTTAETSIKSGRELVRHDKTDEATFSDSESLTQQRPSESTNQAAASKRSLRPVDVNYSNQANESSSIHDLTCMQLADSILGAVNGDLSQVYSLCKSKLRYSDFIEQSQPHRLGDLNSSQGSNIPKATDQNNTTCPVECSPSACEIPQTKPPMLNAGACCKLTQSATFEKPKESTRLPVIKTSPKSYQHVPSRYLNYSGTNNSYAKESEIDANTRLLSVDTAITFGKAGRPILKTFKSDVEPSCRTKDDPLSTPRSSMDKNRLHFMDTNNNANGVPSNRLVRFNTCHEVREFTPSEPIRQN